MLCPHCNSVMKRTMRFEPGKATRFFRCPKCYMETKPKPLYFDDEEIRQNNTKQNIKPKAKPKVNKKPQNKPIKPKKKNRR